MGAQLEEVSRAASCVVVVADESGPGFAGVPGAEDALALWAIEDKRIVGARFGDHEPSWPGVLEEPGPWIDVRGRGAHELDAWIRRASLADAQALGLQTAVARGESFTEALTAIRFLVVEGGAFMMGQKGATNAEPVHRVRLSRYWLGETPVTNGQYARFLAAEGHEEPKYWLDERFAGDTRPVIGVSWDDATKFCEWLSKQAEIRRAGLVITLPSEAQWEFAARGTDGRTYPWGNKEPDATRAVFGRKNAAEATAPVKSCPNGQGPFGHHDLAGNVWEWCRDMWAEDAYAQRKPDELNPVHQAETLIRPLRGDCWYSDKLWAAAVRYWDGSPSRVRDLGFRVAAEPASR